MYIRALSINRFKSIDDAGIGDCGVFNVLIGKNNSGKSNILGAIDSFFLCLKSGDLITLRTPVRNELDFFDKQTSTASEVIVDLAINNQVKSDLVANLVSEAPQMQNAADQINSADCLVVTVRFNPPPNSFACITRIGLRAGSGSQKADTVLIYADSPATAELYERAAAVAALHNNARAIVRSAERIPTEALKKGGESRNIPFQYYLRDTPGMDGNLAHIVEEMAKESNSAEDFNRAVRGLAAKWDSEAKALEAKPLSATLNTFAGQETAVPGYVRKLLSSLSEIVVLHIKERREPIGKDEAGHLLDLKMSRGGPAVLRSLQETVAALLGVQIDAFRGDLKPGRRGEPVAELDVDNFLVQVNGAGIREALRLMLDYEFTKPTILLVEEPEVHLHPALETSMMQYLQAVSSRCQVFITTHSTNFLDAATMSNVFLVSKPAKSTNIQALDAEEAEARLPGELGLRMSSLFLYDRLVFVEGRTDEGVLREWASTLGVNFSTTNAGFVQMGGARHFAHYAAERTLSFLTKRQVRSWFLLDNDDREDAEIEQLTNRYSQFAVMNFLRRREIENYLVVPRAVTEFINWKRSLMGANFDRVEQPAVEAAIQASLEELKDTAVCKRTAKRVCRPVYPDLHQITEGTPVGPIASKLTAEIDRMIAELSELKGRVDAIVEEQRQRIEADWVTNSVGLVPGDLLLGAVAGRFGVRFKKDRDSVRLAKLMKANEIPGEIDTIIRDISTP
jgi:putative ATP-dependent endonuclease of OLD family